MLTIDWFGVGLGSRQVKQSLNRPDGISLPPMLYVDSGEMQLLMESDSVSGDGPAISVVTAAGGLRHLQVENEDVGKLQRLPRCRGQDNEVDAK